MRQVMARYCRYLAALGKRVVGSGVRCGSSSERCRFQQNWVFLAASCSLVGFSYSSALPSLHQFVTSSTHPEDPNVQPGLGLGEAWYSWTVSVLSVGELAGAVATSFLLRRVYTKFLILGNFVVCALGGLLYGIGLFGWMLLIGRFLIGLYMGAVTVMVRTYIGETSSSVIATMPPEKREKATLKYTAFFATFSVCSLSVLPGPALAAVVAKFPQVDQFRWPGYFTVGYAFLLAVAAMMGFREKKGDVQRKGNSILPERLPIPLYLKTVACLVAAFFVINWYFAVFETLLNPILADNFGFDVEYDSYAFFGTLIFFASGLFCLYALQRLHIDNRISCLITLILALVGSLMATDWQSVQGDPCSQFSQMETYNITGLDDTVVGSGSGADREWCVTDPAGYLCAAEQSKANLEDCGVELGVADLNASCVCEAFSGVPGFNCFWNPHSRVTGRDCQRCARLCRSHDRSLNLVQFLVAMSIVIGVIAMGRISITLIVSDALAGDSQALIMGILVSAGAAARFTGPVWGNAAYQAADHHVYIVMNILSGSILLVILPYIVLYRTMKPASFHQLRTSESLAEVELDLLERGSGGDAADESGDKTDQFVSLENGEDRVEGESCEKCDKVKGGGMCESDRVQLLANSSEDEEERL